MSNKGLFITFEGGEGSGKTTQLNRLATALADEGHRIITTREPGGVVEAEKIRTLLVQRDGGQWTPMAEILMLFAARAMHVEKVIKPALAEGKIVICDRFTDSTRAYQGYGHGMDLEKIEQLDQLVLEGFGPDLTFLLDIESKAGLERSSARLGAEALAINQTEDRFEKLNIDFHTRMREGFLEIAKAESDRCHVLDATQSIEALATQIKTIALKKLG